MKTQQHSLALTLWLSLVIGSCGPGKTSTDSGSGSSEDSGFSQSSGSTDAVPTSTSSDVTGALTESDGSSTGEVCVDPEAGDCSVLCQNCPVGEKCVAIQSGSGSLDQSACRSIPADPKAVGEVCTFSGSPLDGSDDCEKGASCCGFPLFEDFTCVPFCQGTSDPPVCGDPMTRCVHIAGKPVCAPICDPRLDGQCPKACLPNDETCVDCFPLGETATFACADFAQGTGQGTSCKHHIQCDRGFFCSPPGKVLGCDANTRCCTAYCDLDSPVCPGGMMCSPIFQNLTGLPGLENLGVCLTP